MIEYDIIVKHGKDQPALRTVVAPQDENYKEVVFQRGLKQCRLVAGDRVKPRGSGIRGTVEEIVTDIESVNWARNRPMFVQVKFDDGKVMLCHPSQLKRSSK